MSLVSEKKYQILDVPDSPDYIIILEETEREFKKRVDAEGKRGYHIHSQSQKGEWQYSALMWKGVANGKKV